jgi:hypothetical protein
MFKATGNAMYETDFLSARIGLVLILKFMYAAVSSTLTLSLICIIQDEMRVRSSHLILTIFHV